MRWLKTLSISLLLPAVLSLSVSAVSFASANPSLVQSLTANSAAVPNPAGRYILGGIISAAYYENGTRVLNITDESGEVWCATGYDCQIGQKVTLVMNSNGTTNDIFDDIIEDVLWCCCDLAED